MERRDWMKSLKTYAKPDTKKVIFQIINTLVPYFALLVGAFISFNQGNTGISVLFSIAAAFFMVRIFIMFHDCTHESFTGSSQWNSVIGYIFGVITFTPFRPWQKEHNLHHGAVGNLDRRGIGDIWTLTVEEYRNSAWYIRGLYRLFRNPLFLFGIAPFFLFLVLQRFPKKGSSKKEKMSILITNIGILAVTLAGMAAVGIKTYLVVQLVVLFVASSVGVWMFYVQHQFEEVYWASQKEWDHVDAALMGSTFYKLPVILEWLSGYIGYHHIHHLNSRIPNYNLKQCYEEIVELQEVKTVTLLSSFKLAFLHIYDEKSKKLISFRHLGQIL